MNTDASNVEDINMLLIIERLSMSCIASSGRWSIIFRNRSLTLCNNDRDFSERFEFCGGARAHIIVIDDKLVCVLGELVHPRASPFLLPTFHQISTLEKTTCHQINVLF